jgi:hypothetical protein
MLFKWTEPEIEDVNVVKGGSVRGLTRNNLRPVEVTFELHEVLWMEFQLTEDTRRQYLHTIQSALRK